MRDARSEPEKCLAEWRKANRWATEAEDAVFLASMAYARGSGPLPAESTRQAAKDLRQRATALLDEALAELQDAEPGFRPGNTGSGWPQPQRHSHRTR